MSSTGTVSLRGRCIGVPASGGPGRVNAELRTIGSCEAALNPSFLFLAGLILMFAAGGCSTPGAISRSVISESVRAEIYERPNREFAVAAFFKPLESSQTNSPTFTFAPLILQETVEGDPNSITQSITTVYCRADKVPICGRLHDQFTYLWRYDSGTDPQAGAGHAWQGIRIALDSAGDPAIWEVLADSSGAKIFFVSESIEEAAVAGFNQPRPGRTFACERDLDEAPNTIVAGVISEGPVPMGPIVYLRAATHDVARVACRCMPSQVKRLAGQNCFTLNAWEGELGPWEGGQMFSKPAFLPPGSAALQSGLEQCLHLPGDF